MPTPEQESTSLYSIDEKRKQDFAEAEQWLKSMHEYEVQTFNNVNARNLIRSIHELMQNQATYIADMKHFELHFQTQLTKFTKKFSPEQSLELINYGQELHVLIDYLDKLPTPLSLDSAYLDKPLNAMVNNINRIYTSKAYKDTLMQTTLLTGNFQNMQSLIAQITKKIKDIKLETFSSEASKILNFPIRRENLLKEQIKQLDQLLQLYQSPESKESPSVPREYNPSGESIESKDSSPLPAINRLPQIQEWHQLISSAASTVSALNRTMNRKADARKLWFDDRQKANKDSNGIKNAIFRNLLNLHINNPLQDDKKLSSEGIEMYLSHALAGNFPLNFRINDRGEFLLAQHPLANPTLFCRAIGISNEAISDSSPITLDPTLFDYSSLNSLYLTSMQTDAPQPLWLILMSIKPIDEHFTPFLKLNAYKQLATACKMGELGKHHKHRQALIFAEEAMALVHQYPNISSEFQKFFGPTGEMGQWIIPHFKGDEQLTVIDKLTVESQIMRTILNLNNPKESKEAPSVEVTSTFLRNAMLTAYPHLFEKQDVLMVKNSSDQFLTETMCCALGANPKTRMFPVADPANFNYGQLEYLYLTDKNPLWLILISIKPIDEPYFTPKLKFGSYCNLVQALIRGDIMANKPFEEVYSLVQGARALAEKYPTLKDEVELEFGLNSGVGRWLIEQTPRNSPEQHQLKKSLSVVLHLPTEEKSVTPKPSQGKIDELWEGIGDENPSPSKTSASLAEEKTPSAPLQQSPSSSSSSASPKSPSSTTPSPASASEGGLFSQKKEKPSDPGNAAGSDLKL